MSQLNAFGLGQLKPRCDLVTRTFWHPLRGYGKTFPIALVLHCFFDKMSGIMNNHSTLGIPVVPLMLETLMAEMRRKGKDFRRIANEALRARDFLCH